MQKKILLVEDSLLPRTVVKALLEQLDCWVDTAETGEEAVILCADNTYNLVFMDIGLPGINGITTTRLIREQEKENNKNPVPIIALTAHHDNTLQLEAQGSGMNGYLTKPLSLEQAQRVLEGYCHKTKAG